MKKIALALAMLASLSACNTISGVCEDVSNGARTVQGWIGN